MTLRLRLVLAFAYLAALILLVSGSAIVALLGLSSSVDVVLQENFRSIEASISMIEVLERMDSEALAALLAKGGPDGTSGALVDGFYSALAEAEGNVTEPDEPAVLARIRADFEAYAEAHHDLLGGPAEEALDAYRRVVSPRFGAVKADAFELLEINRTAMVTADREARQSAGQTSAWLGTLVAIALLSFVVLSHGLQTRVLAPLAELRRDMSRIRVGDLTRRLRAEGSDELAAIALEFNELLDRYAETQRGTHGRVAAERRLSLALLEACGEGAAVFELSGEPMAGDLGELERETIDWLREQGRDQVGSSATEPTRLDNGVELLLLRSRAGGAVAWLARPTRSAG